MKSPRPVVVVSQAWTLDAGPHADAYLGIQRELLAFMREQPGFLGRRILRSLDDPTHFTNERRFASLADYHALAHRDGYARFIERLTEHLKPYESSPREIMELAVDDEPLARR